MFWDAGVDVNTNTSPRLWDPVTSVITSTTNVGYNSFCTGHALLADGRLLLTGGHIASDVGLPNVSTYTPNNATWTRYMDMGAGRWYPTNAPLANGDVLVVSGEIDVTTGLNPLPQVWQASTGTLRDLTNAQLVITDYPWMYLAPNGKVFHAGPSSLTRYLDTTGTGAWTIVGNMNLAAGRSQGSSVMYDDGKVLIMGGGDPPTNSAEVIDLNAVSPAWRSVAPMSYARRQHIATLLPDGKVLVTGGTSGPGFNNEDSPVLVPELWDPATETWTPMANSQVPRLYHSTALLLPDGRVLVAGGGKCCDPPAVDHADVEFYSPPYLFQGARPSITAVPTQVTYGQTFSVQTPDAARTAKVTWLRLGSVTHSFNQNQRINRLNFAKLSGTLNVTSPASANLALPGDYMLFIIDTNGVPSIGQIVRLAPTGAPTSSSPYGGIPWAIPGRIQAEDFDSGGDGIAYHDLDASNNGGQYRPTEGVDIQVTSDTGGGYNVGWTLAGEWLQYTVNVQSAGMYTLAVRVAANGTGGTFHIEVNGIDKTGPLTIPNSGGWQQWQTVTKTGVSLSAGVQVLRVVLDRNGPSNFVGNLNYLDVSASASSSPYGGIPWAIPGRIQAEDFDSGGDGVAYHDLDATNNGGQYRPTEGVDIAVTTDNGGGYTVGWMQAGEWLQYTVNVQTAGTYTLAVRVAANGTGGTFHIEVNGIDKTGPLTIPNTGGWQQWQAVTKSGVSLSAGLQVVRLVLDTNGASNFVGNVNYIDFSSAASSSPFGGTARAIPGRIQAEDFDVGGEGIAYHDQDTTNNGGQYRPSEGVDITATVDSGGGYTVGWMLAGEWLQYTVNVQTAGTYTLAARVAANGTGGTFHIEVNGINKTGSLAIPNTGGWQQWQTVTKTGVSLSAGVQVLRLVLDTNGASNFVGNVNYLEFTP
jgi:predicted Rdx family selenoprotein